MNAEKKLVQYLGRLNSAPVVAEITKNEKPYSVKKGEEVEININTNPWFNKLTRKHK